MTTVANRPVPDGYTEEWDSTIWNVGHVFMWSDVYECWLDHDLMITVKPGQTLSEAYTAVTDEPLWKQYNVFFVDEG